MTPFYDRFTFSLRELTRTLYGLEVIGADRVPVRGRCILCSNHIAYIDPFLIGSVLQSRQIFFMAKKELFETPVVSWLVRNLEAFPVDRGHTDRKTLRRALEVLNSERALGIFPEGTRGDSYTMGEWQSGVAMLATRTQAPIVPVAVIGTREQFVLRRFWPRGRPLKVVFGDPLASGKDSRELLALARQAVQDLIDEHKE